MATIVEDTPAKRTFILKVDYDEAVAIRDALENDRVYEETSPSVQVYVALNKIL
jgi:hypothetical protein